MSQSQRLKALVYLNDSCFVHGDAVVCVSGELMERERGCSVHVRVFAAEILDERRDGVLPTKRHAIVAPRATASDRLRQMMPQSIVVLSEKESIFFYDYLSPLVSFCILNAFRAISIAYLTAP